MENNNYKFYPKPVCYGILPFYNIITEEKKIFYQFCLKISKYDVRDYISSDKEGDNIVEIRTLPIHDGRISYEDHGLNEYFNAEYPKELNIIEEQWFSPMTKIIKNVEIHLPIIKRNRGKAYVDGVINSEVFPFNLFSFKHISDCSNLKVRVGDLFIIYQEMREPILLFKLASYNELYRVSTSMINLNGMNFRLVNFGSKGFGLIGNPSEI